MTPRYNCIIAELTKMRKTNSGLIRTTYRDVRMKADHGKTTVTTEAVSSPPEEIGVETTKWRRNTFRAGKKPVADWKNMLQNYGTNRQSQKISPNQHEHQAI